MEGNGRGSSSLRCESVKVASNQTSGLSPPGRIIVLMSFSHRTLLSLLPIPRNYIVIFHIVNRRRHRPWIDRENFMHAFFWSVDRVTHSRATASGQLASSVILSNYYIRRRYFSMQHDTMRCTVSDFTNLLSLCFGVRFVSPQFVCYSGQVKVSKKGTMGVFNDTLQFSFLQMSAVSSLYQEIRIFGRVTCFLARQDWLFFRMLYCKMIYY